MTRDNDYSQSPRSERKLRAVSLVLTLVSLLFLIIKTQPGNDVNSNYGMIASLPVTLLVGLAALVAAIVVQSSVRHGTPFALVQFLILLGYLWLAPAFLYPALPFPASNHDLVFYTQWFPIIKSGHLDASVYTNQYYPISNLIAAESLQVFGVDNYEAFFLYVPFLLNVGASIFLGLFFKNLFSASQRKYVFVCLSAFQLLNFTGVLCVYTFFSVGYIFFYFGLSVLASIGFFRIGNYRIILPALPLMIVIFIALALSHPEIPLVYLGLIAVVILGNAIINRKWDDLIGSLKIVFLFSCIILAWMAFGAFPLLQSFGPSFLKSLTSNLLSFLYQGSVLPISSATQAKVLLDYTKIALFSFVSCLALISLVPALIHKHSVSRILFLSFLSIGFVSLFVGNIQGYGYIPRIFAYSLPFLLVLDLWTFQKPKRLTSFGIILFLIIASTAFFATNYSDLPVDRVPATDFSASSFFDHYAPALSIIGERNIYEFQQIGFFGSNLQSLNPYYNWVWPFSRVRAYTFNDSELYSSSSLSTMSFFVLGSTAAAQAEFDGGNKASAVIAEATIDAISNPEYGVIYSSNYVVIFSNQYAE
ncbi:MAG: hypothetical protein JRN20_04395 [Nitrososphaerota archaeon]|nr:hypothetical protein [Nitrososphaerota archaeon]MDG6922699.1 hypothetical protein [Nitrososphaerota archaeon]